MAGADWVACPHCGEKIRRDAPACRHCGSDDRTGWSEATYMDGIDIPDEEDYADGLEVEGFRTPSPSRRRWVMACVSLILVGIFTLWLLRSLG